MGVEDDLARPGQVPAEDDVPGLDVVVGEAQALEGDGHLDRVAFGIHLPVGHEDGVPTVVHVVVAAFFDAHHVHLDADGIEEEGEGPALLVEGIEHDEHPVVLHALIAAGDGAADFGGLGVVRPESDVEVLLIVAQVGHGLFGRDAVFFGRKLDEGVYLEGLHLPDRVVQEAVDLGGCRQARDLERLFRDRRLDGGVGDDCGRQGRSDEKDHDRELDHIYSG
jgi:hypothetical protein